MDGGSEDPISPTYPLPLSLVFRNMWEVNVMILDLELKFSCEASIHTTKGERGSIEEITDHAFSYL